MNTWIDITAAIQPKMMTWPDQPPVQLTKLLSIDKGDLSNISHLSLSVHTGTHMDAPLHFINNGADISMFPLDALIGPSRVIEIKDKESIKKTEIEQMHIEKGQRIYLKQQTLPANGIGSHSIRNSLTCLRTLPNIWQPKK